MEFLFWSTLYCDYQLWKTVLIMLVESSHSTTWYKAHSYILQHITPLLMNQRMPTDTPHKIKEIVKRCHQRDPLNSC